ncbi:hypothetical protein [Hyalangium versicolor]|uniref:hypothetical protein n=1 Tax=Hyalangium versicolor TaxID=2861190 RepID=UPI001CCB2FE5|nr:hypothetical protein [Hyalangium versicolor]
MRTSLWSWALVIALATACSSNTPDTPDGGDPQDNPDGGGGPGPTPDGGTSPDAGVETPVLIDITTGLTLIDDIDTAQVAPSYESTAGASLVQTVLGKPARTLPMGDAPKVMSYVIGKGKGLIAGRAYVLVVEYPDDVPRTLFVANRGADHLQGWATGTAVGDSRSQYTEPSVESLNYPQSGQWQLYKQFFYLHDRFQGVKGVRDSAPGCRPNLPADGFNVALFQTKQLNDARSQGVAVGHIKLYEVSDPSKLYAPIHYPPSTLPRRRIFWREEMADEAIMASDITQRAVANTEDWYVYKMRMAKVLGINTFTKDLLEFGYNQGFETGDQNWMYEAQPPNNNLWTRLVPRATAEDFELLPYFEYKSGMGANSLAKQRRAQKLFHGQKQTCGNTSYYTCVYWTEDADADLTDPDTLADAKKLIDKTVGQFKTQAKFAGVWFRTRNTHLPISFAAATIARFKAERPNDSVAQTASQATLIASYQGNKDLYNRYISWWFSKRVSFLSAVRDYLKTQLGQSDVQVLFTPWTGEQVPHLHPLGQPNNHAGVVTDDSAWWTAYMNTVSDGYYKYHWSPTDYTQAVNNGLYPARLAEQIPIDLSSSTDVPEEFHSAPGADPENYTNVEGVMMTYPIGRLFTVASADALGKYRAASGLTVVRHYPLNEDTGSDPSLPFGGTMGYVSVNTDRAGPHLMLQQARAIANGDPRNIAYLSGSSFSTGFPEVMRRFNQAFLAVPALPSEKLASASSDSEVVVRQINTQGQGTYYYVVNTSMQSKANVKVTLPASGRITNLVTNHVETGTQLTLTLESADLRAYRVGP